MQDLAIIGAGFSGAALALQALGEGEIKRVWLIDRSGRFGPGLAYSTTQPMHLLNVRAAKLSALPGAPMDFADWLRPNTREMNPGALFAARSAYGAYLESHMRRAARESNGALKLVREAAVSCEISKTGVSITLASGARIEADAAILALGHAPPAVAPAFYEADIMPIDPWDSAALARIPGEADVLVIGAGLTMIDAVLSLTSRPRSGAIIALSRHGLVPRTHADAPSSPGVTQPLPPRLSEALHAVRREIRASKGAAWQNVGDRLRLEAPAYWRALPPAAQARFLRHLRPWWDAHRHRTAPHIGLWMKALQGGGMVRVRAGCIVAARKTEAGVRVSYRPRGTSRLEEINAAYVVNCTGADADLTKSTDPLVRQLLADGLMRPHWTRLGLDVDEDGAVIDRAGVAQSRLFALGPITQGAFWEITAVPEIRTRAAALAARLGGRAQIQAAAEPSAVLRRTRP